LDWLIEAGAAGPTIVKWSFRFSREKNLPFLVGEFATTAAGKTESLGTMSIGIDPVSGQFMSWHFDPDGGYGHGLWLREGKTIGRWILTAYRPMAPRLPASMF